MELYERKWQKVWFFHPLVRKRGSIMYLFKFLQHELPHWPMALTLSLLASPSSSLSTLFMDNFFLDLTSMSSSSFMISKYWCTTQSPLSKNAFVYITIIIYLEFSSSTRHCISHHHSIKPLPLSPWWATHNLLLDWLTCTSLCCIFLKEIFSWTT